MIKLISIYNNEKVQAIYPDNFIGRVIRNGEYVFCRKNEIKIGDLAFKYIKEEKIKELVPILKIEYY